MATLKSRINVGVTLLVAIVAVYFLWQFLAIYVNAFRFQDAVSGIAFRAMEVPTRPEEIRQSVMGAATLLGLPVQPRSIQVFMITREQPQIDVYYGEKLDLILSNTFARCHVNNQTVDIWFSQKPPELVEKETPRVAPPRKRT